MRIGIDASRAFFKNRTGIEEYSYQVIKSLRGKLKNAQVILYLQSWQEVDFDLPENWRIKRLWLPRLWTQGRLSWELLIHPVDVLFVPAHTVPCIHPRRTVVTIHGLEYEFVPEAYSAWERVYMRISIRNSCRWAKKIICVSKNTRQDLMKLYGVSGEKTEIIHEGYDSELGKEIVNLAQEKKESKPYLLFIGRIEERKNVLGILKSFEVLKREYGVPHRLILVGRPGFGFEKIQQELQRMDHRSDVVMKGFVSPAEKAELLAGSAVFVFPSFYEGFGLPILEAQHVGVPVVAANVSSIPEVAEESAILVDPNEPIFIAKMIHNLISDDGLRNDIIKRGHANVKRFSWDKCASEIAGVLTSLK
jgi:glycosyltransferase involved in cell wall biosynthesis